jgi:hypothetical protein
VSEKNNFLTNVCIEDELCLISCILNKGVYDLGAEDTILADCAVRDVVPRDDQGAQIPHEIVEPLSSVILLADVVGNWLKPFCSIWCEELRAKFL